MELSKLIYDIKESIAGISDDRHIDDRYIEHLINVGRNEFIKKLLSSRPGYNTINLEQNWHANIESASRSIFPGVVLSCNVLRSTLPIPSLVNSDILSRSFKVRTADILNDTIEVITPERANMLSFEFPVVYAFLDYQKYLYLLSKDNHQELKYAVITGVFENPKEVDSGLTDYPIPQFMWPAVKDSVLRAILGRPPEDPINDSEPNIPPNNNDNREREDRQTRTKR